MFLGSNKPFFFVNLVTNLDIFLQDACRRENILVKFLDSQSAKDCLLVIITQVGLCSFVHYKHCYIMASYTSVKKKSTELSLEQNNSRESFCKPDSKYILF